MLDATIPAVQAHLERIFRVMREEWGCTYFKLDANFWGAVQGSRYQDPAATRIENYRRGMEAARHGGHQARLGPLRPLRARTLLPSLAAWPAVAQRSRLHRRLQADPIQGPARGVGNR
jgi:hypothetical protein